MQNVVPGVNYQIHYQTYSDKSKATRFFQYLRGGLRYFIINGNIQSKFQHRKYFKTTDILENDVLF